jgi:hypothetical protein
MLRGEGDLSRQLDVQSCHNATTLTTEVKELRTSLLRALLFVTLYGPGSLRSGIWQRLDGPALGFDFAPCSTDDCVTYISAIRSLASAENALEETPGQFLYALSNVDRCRHTLQDMPGQLMSPIEIATNPRGQKMCADCAPVKVCILGCSSSAGGMFDSCASEDLMRHEHTG